MSERCPIGDAACSLKFCINGEILLHQEANGVVDLETGETAPLEDEYFEDLLERTDAASLSQNGCIFQSTYKADRTRALENRAKRTLEKQLSNNNS